jgi:hypothetical protein
MDFFLFSFSSEDTLTSHDIFSLVLDFLQSYNIIYQSISLLSWLLTFIKTKCQIILHKIGVVCISAKYIQVKITNILCIRILFKVGFIQGLVKTGFTVHLLLLTFTIVLVVFTIITIRIFLVVENYVFRMKSVQ